MDNENILDMMKIGLEYILITLFLLACIQCIGVRNQYANSLNTQYDSRIELKNHLEFSKFYTGMNQNDKSECVTADVVLETIRNYKDGCIRIYVDQVKYGASLMLDEDSATTDPTAFSVATLMNYLDFTAYYHPYLLYDNDEVYGPYKTTGTEITGIAFRRYTGV